MSTWVLLGRSTRLAWLLIKHAILYKKQANCRAFLTESLHRLTLLEFFKGKTQWHASYAKAFPKLANYPKMVAWLEDHKEKKSDKDLWGIAKKTYGFSELLKWLANDGNGLDISDSSEVESIKGKKKQSVKGKEKRKFLDKSSKGKKQKEESKGKGKEKSKEGAASSPKKKSKSQL
jgi:hypothetical protein